MGETLYMAVTSDEYELPLYISDSVKELAEWSGTKSKSVMEQISRWRNKPPKNSPRNYCGYRFRRVNIEEETE